MSRVKEEESAIDNLRIEELHLDQPSIEEINQEIVQKRLVKWVKANGIY